MKYLLIGLLISFLPFSRGDQQNKLNKVGLSISCGPEATCYGNNPCNACKNCNYCKYCNSGGACGICAPVKKKVKPKTQPSAPSQCRATTKKGARCKRSAEANGYCWQHG